MKINGVGVNRATNIYNKNRRIEEKTEIKSSKDTIQISNAAKSLSSLAAGEEFGNSAEKVEALRKEVSQGTYKADSKLVAKKLLDAIKERGV